MGFDFYADMHPAGEQHIDEVVQSRGNYQVLRSCPWPMKAQILATGISGQGTELKNLIQNGRLKNDKKSPLRGYPKLLEKSLDRHQAWMKLFTPTHTMLDSLPLHSLFVQLELKLTRPFHSRDDRTFHPNLNPLKKEWVFHTPYLAASGIKGLLRWAWRMRHGDERLALEERLFGPRAGHVDEDSARQGCLYTWPLFWDGQVGLEVINPQDRATGAGTTPIKYEVVKAGGTGILSLLLMNRDASPDFLSDSHLEALLACLRTLLDGGLSAKRSVDWGSTELSTAKAWINVPGTGEQSTGIATQSDLDPWANLLTEDGELKPLEDPVFTTNILAERSGLSKSQVKKDRAAAQAMVREIWTQEKSARDSAAAAPAPGKALLSQPAPFRLEAFQAQTLAALQNKFSAYCTTSGGGS